MGYMFVNTFLAAPFIALVPAMAQIVLDEGTVGTAVLVTAQGLGAVTMALDARERSRPRFGSRRVLLAVLWSLPPALVVYALMPTLALAAVALFFVGLIYLGALSSFMSIAQIRAPAAIRGRVVSLLAVVLGALYPLGAVLQGAVGQRDRAPRDHDRRRPCCMLVALVVMRLRNPRFADALDEPPVARSTPCRRRRRPTRRLRGRRHRPPRPRARRDSDTFRRPVLGGSPPWQQSKSNVATASGSSDSTGRRRATP